MKVLHPKILMSFCTDWYWYDVAKALIASGMDLAFLVSRPPAVQQRARKELKKTVVIDQDTLEYPYLIEQLNVDNPIILNQEMLNRLQSAEFEFLNISDRLSFFPITVKRRRYIFKELVRYWYYFLQQNKLDAILLTDTPHVGFDTVLFAVAKNIFHLPIISIRRPFIQDHMLLVRDYHDELPKVPREYLSHASLKQLENTVGRDLIRDTFGKNTWQKKDLEITKSIFRLNEATILTRILGNLSLGAMYRYFQSLFELSKYGGFNYNNGQIKLIEKLCGVFHRFSLQRQRRLYESLSQNFNWPDKFIYFPLHLQPERSTIPEGGVYEDQLLAIKLLERCLPTDWKIVVKEHPRQFLPYDFQKHFFRSMNYYRQISNFSSVVLCPMQITQEELITRAQLTATVTGTGGWESLLAGKPTLVFGNAWYSGCRSCYTVDSIENVRRAIRKTVTKTKLEVRLDVLRFLAYYRDRLILASNAKMIARLSSRPYKLLVANMARAVIEEIRAQL